MKKTCSPKWVLSAVALGALSGCASFDLQHGLRDVNQQTQDFAGGAVHLALNEQDRAQRSHMATELLAKPMDQRAAVQMMLTNSPAFQALIAQNWAQAADAVQSGRISNPLFSFERIVTGPETELTRFLSFGLLDVLTLPTRATIAQQRLVKAQLQFAGDVIDQVTSVRQAWVDAVAAQQSLDYARKVYAIAEAGAELAKRMEAVGNFNRVTRARHQALYADASVGLVFAKQQAQAKREALVRMLGLDEAQAQQLQLPDHLPDIPDLPLKPEQVAARLSKNRLDVLQANAQWLAVSKAQGLTNITSLTDVEMTLRRGSINNGAGTVTHPRGYEIGVRLPLFDSGDLQRQGMNARALAAFNNLEATLRAASSYVRESYVAYRSAYDISRQFRDEVLPLQQTIADENILRYNGMIIGVFELMADARQQMNAVRAAIDAQQQFWRADAALQASLIGRPAGVSLNALTGSASSDAGNGH